MDQIFCSRNTFYRDPLGAVEEGTSIHLRIKVPLYLKCSKAHLIVIDESRNSKRDNYTMLWGGASDESEIWECDFTPNKRGLYWYTFQLDTADGIRYLVRDFGSNARIDYNIIYSWQLTCYKKGRFPKIREVMQAVEKGAGLEAYSLARYGLEEDWSALPMDIAYGLRPKLIRAGCEADLLSAVKSNELYEVSRAVGSAESFEKRYNAGIDGLKSAKAKEERLEYANRPDVPAVGMSTSQARSTKLGAPTRTTTEHGSWSHKKHTYGDMVWEKGGRQIFRAHYFDGEIQDIYDTRNSTATSPWASSRKSSSSSKPSFDPDDHDIEAYYEDNRDEYEDYDDAYDGFLDDEGAWDDY